MNNPLNEIAEFLLNNDGFTIVTHVSPDGDTLGSACALYQYFLGVGKRAQLVCSDTCPAVYSFLPGVDSLCLPLEALPLEHTICIDCADKSRLGDAQGLLRCSSINIDHHPSNDAYASMNFVDHTAAATGELVYKLLRALDGDISTDIATCLFTALSTDTGNFAYSNVTKATFEIAAQLVGCGVDVAKINSMIYRTLPEAKVRLLGLALCNMRLFYGGQVAIAAISRADFSKTGALDEDTEGIIDHLRDIDTVKVAALLRETVNGNFKVSLRTKIGVDACALAAAFSGGGHARAAGFTIKGMKIDEALATVKDAAMGALNK